MDDSRGASVLVVGDANPDLVLTGDVVPRFGQAEQLLDGASLLVGGSAAITAHGLGRLGRPVHLLAAVGDDAYGSLLRTDLAAAGVGLGLLLVRPDVETGLTVALSRGDDRAVLTYLGAIPTLSGDDVRAAAHRLGADGSLGHVHVASLFLQPSLAAALPDVLAELRAGGLTVSLDTNDDPAGAWQGVDALLPHVDVLLPNRREACALGRSTDVQVAARTLADAGPLVVVKDGATGAFAVRAGGDPVQVRTTARPAVDTTGAGDTFDAAFLDAWLDGRPLEHCLRRASRAGGLAVTAAGGTTAQPTRADLDTEPDATLEQPR